MEETLLRMMRRDPPRYHEQQASRLRVLVLSATTAAMRTRLLQEAEKHAQIARGEPVLEDE
jgi:hypothetical protein